MAQLVVTQGRETVFSESFGWADAAKTAPMTDSNLCWCFSNTKVYTAVCLMRLVEEGRIGLDDPVCKYLPECEKTSYQKGDGVAVTTKPITVRQLITMTSGLTYNHKGEYRHFMEAIGTPNVTTRDAIRALAQDVFKFEPGTSHCYGLGHDVIAAVIEVITGMRFSEYMNEAILRPLGIRDTGFHPSAEQKARFAEMYRYDGETNTFAVCPEPQNHYIFSPQYESGGAGMFSSPKEYIKLLTVLACGGTAENGYRVLKPETIRQMATNQLSEKQLIAFRTKGMPDEQSNKRGYGYGLGVRVHLDPTESGRKTSVGEFGWNGAAGALSVVDPEKQLAICYVEHVRHHVNSPENPKSRDVYQQIHLELMDLVCEALDQ